MVDRNESQPANSDFRRTDSGVDYEHFPADAAYISAHDVRESYKAGMEAGIIEGLRIAQRQSQRDPARQVPFDVFAATQSDDERYNAQNIEFPTLEDSRINPRDKENT